MGVSFNDDEIRAVFTENSIKENHIAKEEQANSITQSQLDRAQSIQQQKVIHICFNAPYSSKSNSGG